MSTDQESKRSRGNPILPLFHPQYQSQVLAIEEGYDKFGLFLDAEEDNKEQEVSCTRSPRFFDSQGRYMQLLCPPFRALSFSGFSNKEAMSSQPDMNTLPKRALDTRNETQTQDVVYDEEHQAGGNDIIEENGEIQESKDRAAQCDKECSQVLPYLFVGSRTVAQKLSTLHHCGITHILNCVGFACIENFPNDFCYRTLWLEDSPGEDLTCILEYKASGRYPIPEAWNKAENRRSASHRLNPKRQKSFMEPPKGFLGSYYPVMTK